MSVQGAEGRYPTYRSSGLDWIGAVPAHWKVQPLRWCITQIEQGWSPACANHIANEGEWGVTKAGCTNAGRFDPFDHKALPPSTTPIVECELHPGDLLVSRANTGELLGHAAIVKSTANRRLIFCDKLYRIRCGRRLSEHFLVYFQQSRIARFHMESECHGTSESMRNLDQHALLDLPITLPPRDEQDAIVAFLDSETARIDALLAEQDRVLLLLRERRAAMIASAVLGSLAASTLRRPSGVGWIGKIPMHWEAKKIRHVARLESGHTPSRSNADYWHDCTIPWVSLADVKQFRDGTIDEISETEECISELGLQNSAARVLPKGTVILSRTASVGFSVILGRPMATTQDFVNWICGRRLDPRYLLACLRSMSDEFCRLRQGSVHNTIYMPDVAGLAIPLPPIDEQRAITKYISRETSRIDAAIAGANRLDTLLRERRASLIHAAVTGMIDVRSFPARRHSTHAA